MNVNCEASRLNVGMKLKLFPVLHDDDDDDVKEVINENNEWDALELDSKEVEAML